MKNSNKMQSPQHRQNYVLNRKEGALPKDADRRETTKGRSGSKRLLGVRSISRDRPRLRSHLLKYMNKQQQQVTPPLPPNERHLLYCSTYGKHPDLGDTKSSLKSSPSHSPHPLTPPRNVPPPSATPNTHQHQTERKQYKLIGKIREDRIKFRHIANHHKTPAIDQPDDTSLGRAELVQETQAFNETDYARPLLNPPLQAVATPTPSQPSLHLTPQKDNDGFTDSQRVNSSLSLLSNRSHHLHLQSHIKPPTPSTHSDSSPSTPTSPTLLKIQKHLRILQKLHHFVSQSRLFNSLSEEWQQLDFLIFKKYYLEHTKVLNFLNKYPMKNPFSLHRLDINSKELIAFMKTSEGSALKTALQTQNKNIRTQLEQYYSEFDKSKVGVKVNLHQHDNFSHWITQDLWDELILVEYSTAHSQREIDIRSCHILEVIFLVMELSGQYILSVQHAESALCTHNFQDYIQEGKEAYSQHILYRNA